MVMITMQESRSGYEIARVQNPEEPDVSLDFGKCSLLAMPSANH